MGGPGGWGIDERCCCDKRERRERELSADSRQLLLEARVEVNPPPPIAAKFFWLLRAGHVRSCHRTLSTDQCPVKAVFADVPYHKLPDLLTRSTQTNDDEWTRGDARACCCVCCVEEASHQPHHVNSAISSHPAPKPISYLRHKPTTIVSSWSMI